MTEPIRVGAVRYLNAKPLYHRFDELTTAATLAMDYPSRLAEQLDRGDLDVALIPSVEYLRGVPRGYTLVPGIAIGANGPVRSVKLYTRVPFGAIGRLALDGGSRTSQALARIWLDEAYGVRPGRVEELPVGVPIQESTADAVLLIGDRAMRDPDGTFVAAVDMAEAWKALTGLPFVFAVWAVRPGVDLGGLPEQLLRCKAAGLAEADAIAAEHAPRLGLETADALDYLTRSLSYDLGEPEQAGLRLFARKAAALGLAPEGADLVFHRRRDPATHR